MGSVNNGSKVNYPDFDNNFQIRDKQKASESLKDTGAIKTKGEEMTRLVLDSSDPRFNIAAERISDSDLAKYKDCKGGEIISRYFGLQKFVLLKYDDDLILLNINSVCKRLHLMQSDLIGPDGKGKLNNEELIQLLKSGAKNTKQVLDHYQDVFKHFSTVEPKSLKPEILMKVVSTVVKTNLPNPSAKIEMAGHTFIAIKSSNKQKPIEFLYRNKVLGSGSFADVYEAVSSLSGETFAIKHAKPTEKAHQALKDEGVILNIVLPKGNVWGIQAKPQRCINITNPAGAVDGYLVLIKYNKEDYSAQIKKPGRTQNDKLVENHQLLFGLKYLSENNFVHGDIKPENILTKKKGSISKVFLADFGAAQKLSKGKKLAEKTATPEYLPKEDDAALARIDINMVLMKEGAPDWNEAVRQTGEIKKKSDVFAMGAVLFQSYTNGIHPFPYIDSQPNIDDTRRLDEFMARSDVPQEIKELIKEMLDRDYTKRPTAEAAFERFEQCLKNNHPRLLEEIQVQMAEV